MSDAFDQMKNMKNGYTTETHTEEKKTEFKYSAPEPEGNVIKNFILKWGRHIIDFFAWVDVVIAVLAFAIFLAMYIDSLGKDAQQSFTLFTCMIFVPLLILLFTIAANYFIYLLIDIRDSLKELTKK